MKNNLFNWMAIVMVAIVGVFVTSCNKDDGDNEEASIVGTWYCKNRCAGGTDTYTFKSNGTYTWSGPREYFNDETGTYHYNSNTGLFTHTNSLGTTWVEYIPTLTSSYFVLIDEDGDSYTYYKSSSSQTDSQTDSQPISDKSGIYQGHECVDLGLPSGTLWATCNVGASKPEEYGDYFAWGETSGYNGGKTTFDWSTYKYCHGSITTIWKYCTDSYYGTVDDKIVLEFADDAATANWGSGWQMPSFDQFKELYDYRFTTTEWTTVNGVGGRKITSKKNGKSIFLPAAGVHVDTSHRQVGIYGFYWSRSLDTSAPSWGKGAYFYSLSDNTMDFYRSHGQSVRPVRVK